ncbi:MAG: cytochrome c oxidase assembly factor Coa1 family protein [Candidatus Brocadiia bacterium]
MMEEGAKSTDRRVLLLLMAGLLGLTLMVGVIVYFVSWRHTSLIRSHEVYHEALFRAQTDERVIGVLGKSIAAGKILGWQFDNFQEPTMVDLSFNISGSKGTGRVGIKAERVTKRKKWRLKSLTVKTDLSPEPIDLIGDVGPEASARKFPAYTRRERRELREALTITICRTPQGKTVYRETAGPCILSRQEIEKRLNLAAGPSVLRELSWNSRLGPGKRVNSAHIWVTCRPDVPCGDLKSLLKALRPTRKNIALFAVDQTPIGSFFAVRIRFIEHRAYDPTLQVSRKRVGEPSRRSGSRKSADTVTRKKLEDIELPVLRKLDKPKPDRERIPPAVSHLCIAAINSAVRGKTLVVFLVDRSPSMRCSQVSAFSRKLNHDYEEVEENLPEASQKNLKWAVMAYGKDSQIVREPTYSLPLLEGLFGEMKPDNSGIENLGGAIETALQYFGADKYKHILIAALTDEAGDDLESNESLERTVRMLRKANTRFFVLGKIASFCTPRERIALRREQTDLKPKGDKKAGKLRSGWVERGPECPRPELWWVEDLDRWSRWEGRLDGIPSGYGIYNLNRLCVYTKGVYSLLDDAFDYDPQKLFVGYPPDICSRKKYDKSCKEDPLRKTLRKVWKGMPDLYLKCRIDSTEELKACLQKARKGREFCSQSLGELDEILKAGAESGSTDSLHNRKRWLAHAHLTLAELHRIHFMLGQYHEVLAKWQSLHGGGVPTGKVYAMVRGRAPEDFVGPRAAKREYQEALKHIKSVQDRHSDTPWAVAAKRLAEGLHPWRCVMGKTQPQQTEPERKPIYDF